MGSTGAVSPADTDGGAISGPSSAAESGGQASVATSHKQPSDGSAAAGQPSMPSVKVLRQLLDAQLAADLGVETAAVLEARRRLADAEVTAKEQADADKPLEQLFSKQQQLIRKLEGRVNKSSGKVKTLCSEIEKLQQQKAEAEAGLEALSTRLDEAKAEQARLLARVREASGASVPGSAPAAQAEAAHPVGAAQAADLLRTLGPADQGILLDAGTAQQLRDLLARLAQEGQGLSPAVQSSMDVEDLVGDGEDSSLDDAELEAAAQREADVAKCKAEEAGVTGASLEQARLSALAKARADLLDKAAIGAAESAAAAAKGRGASEAEQQKAYEATRTAFQAKRPRRTPY